MHRFTDPTYADLTLAMRTGTAPTIGTVNTSAGAEVSGAVFDQLWERGQIHLHTTPAERTEALAEQAAAGQLTDQTADGDDHVVMASTREQVADLNAAIHDRLVSVGHVNDQHVVTTHAGERLGVGDRVATRRNNPTLGVANRDTRTITHIADDGALTLAAASRPHAAGRRPRETTVPPGHVADHVDLAYASTVYGIEVW